MQSNRFFSSSIFPLSLFIATFFATSAFAQNVGPTVRFHTSLGDIDVILTPETAPLTVANFLSYLNKGAYTNSVFHRSVPGFIIQAGGYQLTNHSLAATPQDPPVKNEFNSTNARGTLAMAKLGTDPNSATNQWFFNLANNSGSLDKQNGGFTVFGRIANLAGLSVMDKIAGLPVYNNGSPFDQIPLNNYSGQIQDDNYALVTSVVQFPFFTAAGVRSAASFTATSANGIAPGELLTIFGSACGPSPLVNFAMQDGAMTASLGGTRVLFDGTPAPLIYTSSGQIGLVAPQNLAGKASVRVVVEYQGNQSAILQFPVVQANPAVFTLNSSGAGDGAIVRPDGSIISVDNPGQPDEILVLYGEGYGAPTAPLNDGAIVGTTVPVPATPVILLIDGQVVTTLYAGGAPTLVNGMLQVNFRVPPLAPGSHQIQLQVGGRTSPSGVTLQTK